MAIDRGGLWFRLLVATSRDIKNSELNLTMDWSDLQSFKDHLRNSNRLKNIAEDTVEGMIEYADVFMYEPEYIQLSADYIKNFKEMGDLKDKLEKELEETRGVSKTKSGKQKI
jgi:hypothetical protein